MRILRNVDVLPGSRCTFWFRHDFCAPAERSVEVSDEIGSGNDENSFSMAFSVFFSGGFYTGFVLLYRVNAWWSSVVVAACWGGEGGVGFADSIMVRFLLLYCVIWGMFLTFVLI
jgi:hypothetical protein